MMGEQFCAEARPARGAIDDDGQEIGLVADEAGGGEADERRRPAARRPSGDGRRAKAGP